MASGRPNRGDDFSLGRVRRLAITPDFAKAYHEIARVEGVADAIEECVGHFRTFPRPNGFRPESLGGRGRHRFWSARIDQNRRIIFLVPQPDEVILVHVDMHDRAYAWVDTHRGRTAELAARAIDVAHCTPIRESVEDIHRPTAEQIARDKQSYDEGKALREQGPVVYLSTPDPTQHGLIEVEPLENFLVLGGPGTGKTVIAIQRLLRQARLGRRVAYVCFNRPLAESVRQMVGLHGGNLLTSQWDVETMYHMCKKIWQLVTGARLEVANMDESAAALGRAFRACSNEEKRAILTSRIVDGTWERAWNERDVGDEIRQVITACHLTTLDAYLRFDRSWRCGRLDAPARTAIWNIRVAAAGFLARKGLVAFEDIPFETVKAIDLFGYDSVRFHEIIIDELQDIPPAFIEVATRLLVPESGRIIGFGDTAQGLEPRPAHLTADRITKKSHSRQRLAKSYRLTRQAAAFVKPWRIQDPGTPMEGDLVAMRTGPATCVVVETTQADAITALANAVAVAVTDTDSGPIGVIHLGDGVGHQIVNALRTVGVASTVVDWTNPVRFADPDVKVVTMRRARGLDFGSVFVLMPTGPDDSRDPITWNYRATSDRAQRVLYVAATRASHRLAIFTADDRHHPLLDTLAPSSYRTGGTLGSSWRRRVGGEDAPNPPYAVAP